MSSYTTDNHALYWVWLNELPGLSLAVKRKLMQAFASPKEIYHATVDTIADALLQNSSSAGNLTRFREQKLCSVWSQRNLKDAETVLHTNEQYQVKILCAHDTVYNQIYHAHADSPLVLYYRGTLACSHNSILGVIGSRSCTSYGRLITKIAVEEAVDNYQIIASGLSFGIDALAHEETLAHGGITYAFLPCGLHKAQPASHAQLMERITQTGAVISPYSCGRAALPFRFIGRNHLLASWCHTLMVVEARMNSGSMDTARNALAKQKHVLSVPNSLLEPQSLGTNQLLAEGARAYITTRSLTREGPHSTQQLTQDKHLERFITKQLHNKAATTAELTAGCASGDDSTIMERLAALELAHTIEYRTDGKWHSIGGP